MPARPAAPRPPAARIQGRQGGPGGRDPGPAGGQIPGRDHALDYRSAWELLVATILSAQSTDVVVNQVTPELFRRYPTVADLAAADRAEVEVAIHATGFFRNKARSIQGAAAYLLEHHGGEVPETIDELVELPGSAARRPTWSWAPTSPATRGWWSTPMSGGSRGASA